MNLAVILILGVGFVGGWYANDKKVQIKTWWNGVKRKFRNGVRDNVRHD